MKSKRKLSAKTSGTSGAGRTWYLLIFGASIEGTTIHKELSLFVGQDVYDAVTVGLEYQLD